jgi:hypothetical protein
VVYSFLQNRRLVPFGRHSFKQNLIASIHKLEGYLYVHNLMHKKLNEYSRVEIAGSYM